MTHVEFIGTGGSGKTKIYSNLIKLDDFYGGYEEDGIIRLQPSLIKSIVEQTPDTYASKYQYIIWNYYLRKKYFNIFLNDCKDHKLIIPFAMVGVNKEHDVLKELMRKTCAKYELGVQTADDDEFFVMDEGFCHRTVSIAVRKSGLNINFKRYFDLVPVPDVLIHINPSDEIINQRKMKRDGESYTSEYLSKRRDFNHMIIKNVEKRGSHIVSINNEQSPNEVIQELLSLLENISSKPI